MRGKYIHAGLTMGFFITTGAKSLGFVLCSWAAWTQTDSIPVFNGLGGEKITNPKAMVLFQILLAIIPPAKSVRCVQSKRPSIERLPWLNPP